MDRWLWKLYKSPTDGLVILDHNENIIHYCDENNINEFQNIVDIHNHQVLEVLKTFV